MIQFNKIEYYIIFLNNGKPINYAHSTENAIYILEYILYTLYDLIYILISQTRPFQ